VVEKIVEIENKIEENNVEAVSPPEDLPSIWKSNKPTWLSIIVYYDRH